MKTALLVLLLLPLGGQNPIANPRPDIHTATYEGLRIQIDKPTDAYAAIRVTINGRHVADWDAKGVLNIDGGELNSWIERNCVAVVPETMVDMHKTLKLRCGSGARSEGK